MSARKTERLVNLVICLLATRRYLSVDAIRRAVPQYAEATTGSGTDDDAFRRMFERDKEELRELGVPLETGSDSVWDDEPGYRIARRDYALPDISLEPDEAAALGLAARLWRSAGMSRAAGGALLKLRAAGVETDASSLPRIEPRVSATEPAFEPCLAAVREGRAVCFGYRRAGGEPQRREVEPWGVVSWRGRWYLVGHDRLRDAGRVFRLSRVVGAVTPVGAAGAVTPPPGVDLVAEVARLADHSGPATARLLVRPGAGNGLRAGAVVTARPGPAGPGTAGPGTAGSGTAGPGTGSRDGWDEISVSFSDVERLAERVAEYGPDVVVLEPQEARLAVVRRLAAVLAPTAGTADTALAPPAPPAPAAPAPPPAPPAPAPVAGTAAVAPAGGG